MENERKTLDDRQKMTDLERIRHSCAHVMATAILRLWPDAQFAAGPPVENGFYYDVDLKHRISPEDFPKIEEEMKKEIKANNVFEKIVVTREQAMKDSESGRLGGLTERPENPSKFKVGNLEAIPEGEPISYFKNGDFIDLCAGPHVMRTGNIGAFKLTHVASAYYKGDERNPQLQRIYGTAFKNKTEMEAYFTMLEEAKRRDHRKIGAEMGLFALDTEYVGPGLPLWLPKGTAIVEELEKLAKETEFAAGYVRVKTPHIAKEKMYKTSGHLPYYAESMFPAIKLWNNPDMDWPKISDDFYSALNALEIADSTKFASLSPEQIKLVEQTYEAYQDYGRNSQKLRENLGKSADKQTHETITELDLQLRNSLKEGFGEKTFSALDETESEKAFGAALRNGARQAPRGLRDGGSARVRNVAPGGHAGAVHGTRHAARHVQPEARGPCRYAKRGAVRGARTSGGRTGAMRNL